LSDEAVLLLKCGPCSSKKFEYEDEEPNNMEALLLVLLLPLPLPSE
jgi:hypothetical protein